LKSTLAIGAGLLLTPRDVIGPAGTHYPLKAFTGKEPTLRGKKVLFLYGGWDGHEPDQSVDVFVPWSNTSL